MMDIHGVHVVQIVLENSSREDKHECPFARCAIELTRVLCDILQVGELRKSFHFVCCAFIISLHK